MKRLAAVRMTDVERAKKYRQGPTYRARMERKRAERAKCKKLLKRAMFESTFTSVSRKAGRPKSSSPRATAMSLMNLLLLRWARCSSSNLSDLEASCDPASCGITLKELASASALRS